MSHKISNPGTCAQLILFNKPFGVVSQFSGDDHNLGDWLAIKHVYPAGRLDKDSEGLLLLTDHGGLQHQLTDPRQKTYKTYWVQVEGVPDETAIDALRRGVTLKDGLTLPARARVMTEPEGLWPRDPPVRYRASIPTSWLELSIREGRNRQVRRMTAAVGHPTLRLIRAAVGPYSLEKLAPGEHQRLTVEVSRLNEQKKRPGPKGPGKFRGRQ